jgi:transcriptional regulator with PAS, ATPase and Fis domain
MASSRVLGVRWESLLQKVREPLFWLNSDLKLNFVNRAWEALTGYNGAEALGLICRAHGPTREGDLAGLGGSLYPPPEALAGQPASQKTLIIHAGGARLWRRVEFWPLHDEGGQLLGWLGQIREADSSPAAPDSEAAWLRGQLLEVRARLLERYRSDSWIGSGAAHRRLLEQIRAAAATDVPVLILGEPGTGKRLIARLIHLQSAHGQAPLVGLDCEALPAEVLERELFAALGSGESERPGLRDGSTLVVGDILALPRDLQSRLAAILEAGTPRVRIVATTSGVPEAALKSERLRPDLYFALTTLVIRVSPLRERIDDVPLIAQHLLERLNQQGEQQRSGFTPEAMDALQQYDWPGNVRELSRVVDEVHVRSTQDLIQVDDLPSAIRGQLGAAYTPPSPTTARMALDELLTEVERRLIEQALLRARQNKSRAAEFLGISRPRLYRRIRELNIPDEEGTTQETASSSDHES